MSHLSEEQLQDFKERLLEARSAIIELIRQTNVSAKPVDLNLPIGRLSRIDAMQMQGMAQMSRGQLDIRLKQVEASLQAFDRGNYGICRHCKNPVGIERLKVLPESPFCVACQESFEQSR